MDSIGRRRLAVIGEVVVDVAALVETRPQDLDWTRWADQPTMVADLRDHIRRLRACDASRLDELRLIFAPTGSLQEASISSGWAETYLLLAARFDSAVDRFLCQGSA